MKYRGIQVRKGTKHGLLEMGMELGERLLLCLQLRKNVAGFRKAMFSQLGKYFFRVNVYLKATVRERLQLKFGYALLKFH
jgi:hypothetical protein